MDGARVPLTGRDVEQISCRERTEPHAIPRGVQVPQPLPSPPPPSPRHPSPGAACHALDMTPRPSGQGGWSSHGLSSTRNLGIASARLSPSAGELGNASNDCGRNHFPVWVPAAARTAIPNVAERSPRFKCELVRYDRFTNYLQLPFKDHWSHEPLHLNHGRFVGPVLLSTRQEERTVWYDRLRDVDDGVAFECKRGCRFRRWTS